MKSSKRSGFTLIELLVVVGLVLILVAMTFSVVHAVRQKMEVAKAKGLVVAIKDAVHSYHNHYDRLPIPREDVVMQTYRPGLQDCRDIMEILQGTNQVAQLRNPAKMEFLRVPDVNAMGDVVDPWSNHFVMLFDANLDGDLLYGDTLYHVTSVVISLGPDGEEHTNDDIVSFR